MQKAKDLIGDELLDEPEQSLLNLKLALRVCAEFRGCYLDFRERADSVLQKSKEQSISRISEAGVGSETVGPVTRRTGPPRGGSGGKLEGAKGGLCAWPPRNSPVFAPLNAIMERCNDLLELVQTLHDFRYAGLHLENFEGGMEIDF